MRLNKLQVYTFQKAIKFWMTWGSSRMTWAILFPHHMHFFFLFFPPSHRWVLEAEPTLGHQASCRQLWWGVKRRHILLLSARQTAHVWTGGGGGLHLWPGHNWPQQRSGTKVGSVPWICTDYGTGFVFPASRCFFAPLNCSGGRELTSRSTWKMHGQDVSNCVTVALCKGVITLNSAHTFTWQTIKTPARGNSMCSLSDGFLRPKHTVDWSPSHPLNKRAVNVLILWGALDVLLIMEQWTPLQNKIDDLLMCFQLRRACVCRGRYREQQMTC